MFRAVLCTQLFFSPPVRFGSCRLLSEMGLYLLLHKIDI